MQRPDVLLTRLARGLPRTGICAVTTALVLWSSCISAGREVGAQTTLALGVYLNDIPDNLRFPADPTAIDRYTQLAGRPPAIVMWFQNWNSPSPLFPTKAVNAVWSRGEMPMITWQPSRAATDPGVKNTLVTAGSKDALIRQWALGAKKWGHPFFLRFAHEMNGNWYPWAFGPGNRNANTPADYVAEWRHVHDIFTSIGATNALWVWEPALLSTHASDPSPAYPGDSYVDWMALDGYNRCRGRWQSLGTLFAPTYRIVSALSSKPMMITETASAEELGNKGTWITQGFLHDMPTLFPRFKAVIWFDSLKECDWRLNSDPGALEAWHQVATSTLYSANGSDLLRAQAPPTATPVGPSATAVARSRSRRKPVSVSLKSALAPGSRQIIRIRTAVPHEDLKLQIVFPNGDRQLVRARTGSRGKFTYSYVQHSSEITAGNRKATVTVQVGRHTKRQSYTISYGQIDVAIYPRSQRINRWVTIWVHSRRGRKVTLVLATRAHDHVVTLLGRTGYGDQTRLHYRVGSRLKGRSTTRVQVSAFTTSGRPRYSTTSFFYITG